MTPTVTIREGIHETMTNIGSNKSMKSNGASKSVDIIHISNAHIRKYITANIKVNLIDVFHWKL